MRWSTSAQSAAAFDQPLAADWREIPAVLAAAAIHLIATLALDWHGVDIVVIGTAVLGYVAIRVRHNTVRAAWGLRRLGFGTCARAASLWLVSGATALAVIALLRGSLVVELNLLPLLVLYPLWGIVQQLLVLGMLAHNLDVLGVRRPMVLAVAAFGFAAVHVPDWPLVGATALLGLVNALLFFRHRNLWPLALLHGWLGALFYRWVLDRDVWGELLQALR